jgi:hypothetical protein
MGREEQHPAAVAAGDLHRRERGRAGVHEFVRALQAAQRGDHLAAAGQSGGAGIGAEFAGAREPGDDHRAEDAEGDVEHDGDHELHHAAVAFIHRVPGDVGDDARGEHHERVHDALDERHRDHVAVLDVRDFVREHAFDFITAHAAQQARRDGHEAARLARAGREGVDLGRVVEAHFRHRQLGLTGEALDRAVEPVEFLVARAAVHELHVHGALGHPARHLQRDERAHRTPEQAEDRERRVIEPATGDAVAAEPEQAHEDRNGHHDREVGDDEEQDALQHGCV